MSTETTTQPAATAAAPSAWETLAQRCRELAHLADKGAALAAAADTADPEAAATAFNDLHERVDEGWQAVRRAAGECRQDTYRTLRQRMDVEQIAEAFVCSATAVYKILARSGETQ